MILNRSIYFLIVLSLIKPKASENLFSPSHHVDFSIKNIQRLTRKGVKCIQIIQHFSNRTKTLNPKLNAIISFNYLLEQQAHELDELFSKKRHAIGLLHCVPILVKDNINVANLPTTGGILAFDFIPNNDAPVVAKLKAQGALVLGKANLAELAFGNDTSETGGQCQNPFDFRRTCGRSSSGVAASTLFMV